MHVLVTVVRSVSLYMHVMNVWFQEGDRQFTLPYLSTLSQLYQHIGHTQNWITLDGDAPPDVVYTKFIELLESLN